MAYEFKTTPYAHQSQVLKESWDKTVWAYFLEMGTGKSKICIDNAAILFERGQIDTLIVIAPKGVYRNWAHLEVPAHLPERIEHDLVIWRSTPNKTEKKALTALLEPSETFKILIMNVEALSTAKGQKFLGALLGATTALLAVDESTSIKSPRARRTKALLKLGTLARYRRILTGFPVTQSPMDLWAQARFLGEHLLGDCGDNFYQFQYRYAVMKKRTMGSHTFNQVVGYRNLEKLSELIGRFSSRILKEECLDLPEKVYLRRNVTLTDDQKRIYTQLKEYALAHLDDDQFMTTPNVLTQLLRMQQVLSGHTMSNDGSFFEIKDNRLDELMNCLEELDGQTIIWARFRYDVIRIAEALATDHGPEAVVSYFGDTSDDDRTRAIDNFQNGEARFFVGNPQSGGYGITLTAAQNVIYFSNSFDLAIRMQSEDRAHRIGQKKSVTYIDLIAEGTIDEKIVKALRSKMDIASLVLGEDLRTWLS